jgi:hypothetical protein
MHHQSSYAPPAQNSYAPAPNSYTPQVQNNYATTPNIRKGVGFYVDFSTMSGTYTFKDEYDEALGEYEYTTSVATIGLGGSFYRTSYGEGTIEYADGGFHDFAIWNNDFFFGKSSYVTQKGEPYFILSANILFLDYSYLTYGYNNDYDNGIVPELRYGLGLGYSIMPNNNIEFNFEVKYNFTVVEGSLTDGTNWDSYYVRHDDLVATAGVSFFMN